MTDRISAIDSHILGISWLALSLAFMASPSVSAAEGKPFVYVGGYDKMVVCFELDPVTGDLKELSRSDCAKAPAYMAWNPSRKFMYIANEVSPGKVAAYGIDPADGKLSFLNDASAGGNGPCHIAVHPDGKWVFTASYGSGHIGVAPINADGTIGTPLEPIQGGKNAHQIVIDPSGKFVFVPFLGSNHVNQYVFDEATGKLTPNDPPFAEASAPKAGPRHMVIHPSGKFAYVINELNSTVDRFDYDKSTGRLSKPHAIPTLPEGTDLKQKSTAHIVASSDGRYIYGSNRGHDSIVIYSVDHDGGQLTLVGHETGAGEIKTPRDFSLDLSGKFAIVANQGKDYLTVFKRDEVKGTLEKIAQHKVTPGAAFVGVMPRP